MKKILHLILLTISIVLLASCNKDDVVDQLDGLKSLTTPEVFISDSGLATWDKVKYAEGYAYRINGEKAVETDELQVQLELGDSIRVKALGDGEKYKDSKYSEEMTFEGSEGPESDDNDLAKYNGTYVLSYIEAELISSGKKDKYELGDYYFGTTLSKNTIKSIIKNGKGTISYNFGNDVSVECEYRFEGNKMIAKLSSPVDLYGQGDLLSTLEFEIINIGGSKGFILHASNGYYNFSYHVMQESEEVKTPTTIDTIKIYFKANGGEGYMASQTASLDGNIYLPENKFHRDGYNFIGWSTSKNDDYPMFTSYIPYYFLEELSVEKLTLYAIWEEEDIIEPTVPVEPYDDLVIWVSSESVYFYEQAIEEYKKITGFPGEIRVVGMDTGSAADIFLCDPEAGADIFTVPHDSLGRLLDSYGVISPIKSESLINQIKETNPEAFLDVCYLPTEYDYAPQYYAVPYISQSLVLYYDKSIFDGQEDKLASWEGILEVARQYDKMATAFSGTDGYNYSAFLLAQPYNEKARRVFGAQGSLQLYRGGIPNNCMGYGDDQVAIHKWAQRFINDPNGRNGAICSSSGWENELSRGSAITMVGGPWLLNSVASALGYNNYGIVELPTFTLTEADAYGSATAGMTFHSGSYVDCKCFVKKANSEWNAYLDDIIEYLSSDEMQERSFRETGTQPSSINVNLVDNDLATAQVAQSEYGIAQPFGFKAKFNTYYYSKGAPDLYVMLHQNYDGLYSTDSEILETLQTASYIWAKGKNPSNSKELADWVTNKGYEDNPTPTPSPVDDISYHVVGGYYGDWSDYTSKNKMVEISLGELEQEIAINLLDKNIKCIYKYEGRVFGNSAGWTCNAFVNGEVVQIDGGFTIKIVKASYDAMDDVMFVQQWNPDPKTSAVQNLTPGTLFMPKWVETPAKGEEGLGTWVDNPVVIAGAGVYTVYFIEYGGTNSYESPKYAMALVKTYDHENPDYTDVPFVEENFADGYYNYVYSSAEERAKILGLLEKYAINNNLTGITLYENSQYYLYHDSVVKATDTYIPNYGFGIIPEGYISSDLEGETNPAWSRYYHTYENYDPSSINYMVNSNNLSQYVTSTYFDIRLNETKDGFNWVNVQANDIRPVAVNPTEYNGNVAATKYRIEVKVGSQYRYNTLSTNPSIAAYNGTEVKLEDYLTPYKIYFTQAFGMNPSFNDGSIRGMEDYCYASADGINEDAFNNTGIKAYYENGKAYLEFELTKELDSYYAMYYISNLVFSPVPYDFITTLGHGDFASGVSVWGGFDYSYGLTPVDTWLSTGPYTIECWEEDKQIVFKKNPYYNLESSKYYQIEGVHVNILHAAANDPSVPLKEFLCNNLHYCSIPTDYLDNYKDDPRAVLVPGSSTFKLNLNTCTQEEWIQLFGEYGSVLQTNEYNYWDCEPIMSNNDFIKGLSYAINREELATMLGCAPSNNYFSDEYLIDPENGVVYNDTKYHQENIAELTYGTQYGYNFDYAVESFRKAAEELISQGAYWYGDTIEIEIAWMSQSDENKYHIYIKNYIESAWNSANTGLNLNVTFWCGTRWDEVYYDKMMAGQFDIAWGSISGNPLNPINFLEVLKSDNSSGFTLNWGSDTSQVSQELFYDGVYWSFDSLWYAADKGGYFINGYLQ